MKKFFEIFGRGILVILIVVGVIGGLGYGAYSLDKSLKDYQAEVDITSYGARMNGYMRVCTNLEVPPQVCILAFPGGKVK